MAVGIKIIFFSFTPVLLSFDQYKNIGVNKIGIMTNLLSEVFGSNWKWKQDICENNPFMNEFITGQAKLTRHFSICLHQIWGSNSKPKQDIWENNLAFTTGPVYTVHGICQICSTIWSNFSRQVTSFFARMINVTKLNAIFASLYIN